MRRAIILHGMPSEESYRNTSFDSQSNSHWLPWLQQQLCARDILAQTPEMPRPYAPDYELWKNEFETLPLDEKTILVGHSLGGGFLLRWLTETDVKVQKLVLVAPWLDVENDYGDLLHFSLDQTLEMKTEEGIDILYSTNDDSPMQTTLSLLEDGLKLARYHEFKDYGHFCFNDLKTREFPELLSICLDENH